MIKRALLGSVSVLATLQGGYNGSFYPHDVPAVLGDLIIVYGSVWVVFAGLIATLVFIFFLATNKFFRDNFITFK